MKPQVIPFFPSPFLEALNKEKLHKKAPVLDSKDFRFHFTMLSARVS
jgi:hypothetical protein